MVTIFEHSDVQWNSRAVPLLLALAWAGAPALGVDDHFESSTKRSRTYIQDHIKEGYYLLSNNEARANPTTSTFKSFDLLVHDGHRAPIQLP
jgi:hypothetical protein